MAELMSGLLADLDERAPHSTKLYAWSLLVRNGLIAPEVWLEREMSNTLLLYHPVPCLRALLAFGQNQCQAVLSAGEQAASIQQHVTRQAHLWQTELVAEYTTRRQQHPDAAAWLPGPAEQLAVVAELKEVFRSRFGAAQGVAAPLSSGATIAQEADEDSPSTFAPEERPESSSADAIAELLSCNTVLSGDPSPATAADTLSVATSPSESTAIDEGRQEQSEPWTETPLSKPSRQVLPPVDAEASNSDTVVESEAGQSELSAPEQGTPAPLRTPSRTRLPAVGSSAYTQQGLQTVQGSFAIMPANDQQLPSVHNSMIAGMEEVQIAFPRAMSLHF